MKKLILTAAVLALAGMNIQSARAGVSISIGVGLPLPGFVAVSAPVVFVPAPPVPVICPPAPYLRPAVVCAPPPVVIVRPRPVCVTASEFGAIRGDCRGYDRGNWYDDRRQEKHRSGRGHHHYR